MSESVPVLIHLRVEAIEDLYTGSGTGGGDIDALVQRDRHNQPVIRASHLKGLLREAGEELIALGALTDNDLDALLGSTKGSGRGALLMTSLRVSKDTQAKTLVWGATQRQEHNRAPKDDTLRFIEHIAAGACFAATLRLADVRLQPLLERLLNRIDRLGGNRNRGGGLVKLDWQIQPLAAPDNARLPSNCQSLQIVLRNLEPLCLPATGYPGNLIRTHSFIRGQALRGALIAWAIHNGHQDQIGLFEQIAVGDALPLPNGCQRAEQVLPIPLSILTDKPSGGNARRPWWAGQSDSPETLDRLYQQQDKDKEKPKRPGGHEYLCCTAEVSHWQRYSPPMRVRLRNATPKRQSTEDTQLFSLEEIAEDTCFQADLHCTDQQTAHAFCTVFAPLLTGTDWLALGRGGQPVCIESVGHVPSSESPLLGDDWTLTLTSDAIVRGERLEFVDSLDEKLLCQLGGITDAADLTIADAVVETETVHGFNAVTGLPRPPALALRRGSCWRITGTASNALAQALRKYTHLGERGNEGFGRFVIGLHPLDPDALGKPPSQPPAAKPHREEELLAQARTLARQLNNNGPSLSQLQWLRSQALALQTANQLEKLLSDIKQAPDKRKQGGAAWKNFPHDELSEALNGCQTLDEQRQLINYLVQWRVLEVKEVTQS